MVIILLFSTKSFETEGARSVNDLSKSVVDTVQDQDKALAKAYEEETQETSRGSSNR